MTKCKIVYADSFKKSLKILQKRYRHVKDDVRRGLDVLQYEPALGDVIPGGHGIRKLRIRNSDNNKGKSAGYRLLYYADSRSNETHLYILLLYGKSDQADVSTSELKGLLRMIDDSEST